MINISEILIKIGIMAGVLMVCGLLAVFVLVVLHRLSVKIAHRHEKLAAKKAQAEKKYVRWDV